jgi:hypothetical protein
VQSPKKDRHNPLEVVYLRFAQCHGDYKSTSHVCTTQAHESCARLRAPHRGRPLTLATAVNSPVARALVMSFQLGSPNVENHEVTTIDHNHFKPTGPNQIHTFCLHSLLDGSERPEYRRRCNLTARISRTSNFLSTDHEKPLASVGTQGRGPDCISRE